MPRIREVDSGQPISGTLPDTRRLKRREVGGIGRGIRSIGEGLTSLSTDTIRAREEEEKAARKREVTDVRVQFAKAQATASQELEEKLKNRQAGDEQFATEFLVEKSNELAELRSKYITEAAQQEFDIEAADFNLRLGQKVLQEQSQQDGQFARTASIEELDARKTIVLSNPLDAEIQIEKWKTSVRLEDSIYSDAPKAAVDLIEKEGIRDLTRSAITGLIAISPELAEEQLKDKTIQDRLDSDDLPKFAKEIDGAKKAKIADQRIARAEEEAATKKLNEETFASTVVDITAGEGASAEAIMQNGNMNVATRIKAVNFRDAWAQRQNKPIEENRFVKRNLRIAIDRGELTKEQLVDNFEHISIATFDSFSARIEKQTTEHTKLKERFIKRQEPRFTKTRTGKRDVSALDDVEAYDQAVTVLMDQEIEAKRDPSQTIFNRNHASYVGREEFINLFRKTPAQARAARRAARGGGVATATEPAPTVRTGPQRKPGETAAAFIARTGG